MTISESTRIIAADAVLRILNECHADGVLTCITEGYVRTVGELMAVVFASQQKAHGEENGAAVFYRLQTLFRGLPRDTRLFT